MTVKEAFDSIVEDGIAKGAGGFVDPEALEVAAIVMAKKIRGTLVEVVRCKDCKNNGECSIQDAMNWTPRTEIGDTFCSYGERSNDGKSTSAE